MSAPNRHKSNSLQFVPTESQSVETQVLIDRICTSFESEWQSKQSPSIEEYIAANSEIDSHLLLKELIPIELELRAKGGQQGDVGEYLERFPQDQENVKKIITCFSAEFPGEFDPGKSLPRYIRRTELARGGMGVVYEGWDRLLHREVAIKVMDKPLADDWEARARFQREPRICGSLQHPNIIPVYDVGTTEDGSSFFVMKRIHGETLDKWLDEVDQPKSLEQKLDVFLSVGRAVASAHRKNIVHRDIKPTNIMIAEFGEVYVMDWGLAGRDGDSRDCSEPRDCIDDNFIDTPLTQCGTVFGTPDYMAPEQQTDPGPRSHPQVDVYSLGALLCWMLVGKSPRRISGHTTDQPGNPEDITQAFESAKIDSFLCKLVTRCVASRPEERYATASELVEDVETYQTWMAARARDAQRRTDAAVHQTKLVRLRWQTTAIACVLLTVIATGTLWNAQRTVIAKQQRVAEATRLLSRVDDIYFAAASTGDFTSPHWQQAVELHDSLRVPIENLKEDSVLAKNAFLNRRLRLMSALRDVPKYEFDGSIQEFTAIRYRNTGLDAIELFGIRSREMTVEDASKQLAILSTEARRMIAGFLVDCCVSANLKQESFGDSSWWRKLAAIEEQKVLGTSLLDSLMQYDKEVLVELVTTKAYRDLPQELLGVVPAVLSAIGEPILSEEVFRFAVSRYSKSFSLNNDFSQFLVLQKPKRAVEALEFSSAAWTIQKHEASMLNLAWCLLECGMFERSVELIESNEKSSLTNAGSLKPFVRELIGVKQLDRADRILRIVKARQGAPVLLHMLNGELAAGRHELATAEREFALARSFCRANAAQFAEISYFEGRLGNLNDIRSRLEEFHIAHPNEQEIIFNLAQIRQRMEQYEAAEELYRKCIRLRPANAEAICNLAYCVNRLNRREEALELYKRGHEIGLNSKTWPYDSGTWITTLELKIAVAKDIDIHIRKQLDEQEPARFYSLITEFLRPTKRFDSAYSLCKVIPDNLRDPKLWLTAASIAADRLTSELDESADSPQEWPEEMISNLLSWMERAVSIMESAPLTGSRAGPRGEYFLLAMREATQTETYRTLRELTLHESLPSEVREKLDSLWLRLQQRADEILDELG